MGSPLPVVPAVDDPRLAGFYDRVLVGQPYLMNAGLSSEVRTVVVGKSRSMNYDGRMLVEAPDGRRWEVGSDRIKRQLIDSGVNINIVYLWEALSLAERQVLRGLAFEPVPDIDQEFMTRYGVRLADGEEPAQVVRMLRSRYRLVGVDDQERLVIGNHFVLRWIRRMGRPNPEAALPAALSDDEEALAVVAGLRIEDRKILRALAFEPTDSFEHAYCLAHRLDPTSTLERFHALRLDRRLIELDHNDRYVLRGRALRRVVVNEWAAERRACEQEMATEEDAGALVTSLSRAAILTLRAIAWRPGDPRDTAYRVEAHLALEKDAAAKALQELLDRSVILSRVGRFEVADGLVAAWTRGVMSQPSPIRDVSAVAATSGAAVLDALQRKIMSRGLSPVVRSLLADPPVRVDEDYLRVHGLEAGTTYRGICWLMLDLGLLDRSAAGHLAFRDAGAAAVLNDRFKAETIELPLDAVPAAAPRAMSSALHVPGTPRVALKAKTLALDL